MDLQIFRSQSTQILAVMETTNKSNIIHILSNNFDIILSFSNLDVISWTIFASYFTINVLELYVKKI